MSGLLIALITGLLGMIGWGTSDYFVSSGLNEESVSEEAGNFWLNLSGVIFSLIIFLGYFIFTGNIVTIPSLSVSIILEIIGLACMNFVGYLFLFRAFREGKLTVISSVFSTYAAGAVVVSALLFGETIPLFRLISLMIVIVGVILVSIGDIYNFKKVDGIRWVIPAVILFSLFFPLWDSIAQKGGSLFLVLFIDTLLAILYFCYATYKKSAIKLTHASIKPFLIGGILTTIAAMSVSWGYEHTDMPSIVSVISSAVPVPVTILGYVFLKERLSRQQYIGLGVIIVGVILLFG